MDNSFASANPASAYETVYDWTYLALAIFFSCKFVTADEGFFKALATTEFESNLKWIADV